MSSNSMYSEIRAAMIASQMDLSFRKEVIRQVTEGAVLSELMKQWEAEKQPEICGVLEKFQPEREIEKGLAEKIEFLSITDSRYPELLSQIEDAPLILYARGQIEMAHDLSFAVVGARHASFYGMEQARRFSRVLSDAGLTIVSGMALGIDQAAHEAALKGSGRTVAVLGCGVDVIYPSENESLYHRIAEQGLVLSEYPFGAEPRAYHFPRRNRILSGLSLGVLVVEAHERSGSLITAYQALEQGREVFAMPGPVHHITSRGTHRLIREGAELVEAPEEILMAMAGSSHLSVNSKERRQKNFQFTEEFAAGKVIPEEQYEKEEDERHKKIVKLLMKQSRDYDGLLEFSGMSPSDFATVMTELEVEGKVRKNFSGYYELG
ncbi:MAG TPA: DNA-processing protein DprA [Candidatus Omnitrophota bacterium]|nr:DNA-processing protein DprA [Candidatus Omnitrophota bacterium]